MVLTVLLERMVVMVPLDPKDPPVPLDLKAPLERMV
jgi:hypothetical protein